jgi:tetratricopeptide (TPR) repeat protein
MLRFGLRFGRPGVGALSRPEKTKSSIDLGRRNFVTRCCQGISAAILRAGIGGLTFSPRLRGFSGVAQSDAPFHVRPHYRSERPLDVTLERARAGLDEFVGEKYADQIALILAAWSANLLESPLELRAIAAILTSDFAGSSLLPAESVELRPAPVEVWQVKFAQSSLGRDAFLGDLHAALSDFSAIVTAEFEITGIDGSGRSARLDTQVRYEVVGSGKHFHREQRVGYWQLGWVTSSSGEFRLGRWKALEETRSRAIGPIFEDVTVQALGENPSYSSQLLHGSDYWRTVLDGACGIDIYGHNGVSVGDFDNDGHDDLYVCQPAGLPNRLYRNRGNGRFEDVTESSGVGILENTACALFLDIDNDGRQDLVVVRGDGPVLFLNQGGGRFQPRRDAFKFANPPQGTFTGAAAADYDRDGWVDIYFCLYSYYQGTDQYQYPLPYYAAENGPPNFLMRNNRDGTFSDVTAATRLTQNNRRYSFCCGWTDYNRDGWPDLYVVNDFGRKNLYRNNGDGTFTDVASQAGVEDVGAGMSVCWLDYDNDGREDLYVADMWTAAGERVSTQAIFKPDTPADIRALYHKHAMGNSLFHNEGNAFQDRTEGGGVGVGRWSWSSDAWDFDHDGFLDLYIANGMVSGPRREDLNSFFWRQVVAKSPDDAVSSRDYEEGWNAINELIRSDGTWSGYERNVFYVNNRNGTFADASGVVGLDFIEDGRSFALADFDHDGRLEVCLKNRNAPQLRVLKNVIEDLPPAIAFRLRGTESNRDAIGAVIIVEAQSRRQTRSLQAGSGFLSQHGKEVWFGLGKAGGPVHASIVWPRGRVQELEDLPVNHRVWVEEGSAHLRLEPFKPSPESRASSAASSRPGAERSHDNASEHPEFLPVTVETWLLAPLSAPDFSLPDLAGQAQTLSRYRGKAVLLGFWVMHSADCQEIVRAFRRFYPGWHSRGLELLTINVDDSSQADRLRDFRREYGLSFPILRGSDDVVGIYNILYRYAFDRHRDLSLPTSLLIDAEGNIVKLYQGAIRADHVIEDFENMPHNPRERLAKAVPFSGVTDTSEFPRNYLSYGSVFFACGYCDQAGSSFERAFNDDPSSAEALYGIGSVYLEQGKSAQARASFQGVTKLQASYPDTLPNAWNNLGLIATREDRIEEAIPYFQEALRLSPDHLVALENLGNAYRQQKQWDEARKTLERAVQVAPEDPEANYSLGMVFAQLNDTDRAYQYLQQALKLRPGYPEALNNLGVLYLRTQRRDEAVAKFEECIRIAPGFDQSYLNLARVYSIEGRPDKARSVLRELLARQPDNREAGKMLAELGP